MVRNPLLPPVEVLLSIGIGALVMAVVTVVIVVLVVIVRRRGSRL
jgi:hypothetical protein